MYGPERKEKAFDRLIIELGKNESLYHDLIIAMRVYYLKCMGIARDHDIEILFRQFKDRIYEVKKFAPRAFIHSEKIYSKGVVGKNLTEVLNTVNNAKSPLDKRIAVERIIHLMHSSGILLSYLYEGMKGTGIEELVIDFLDKMAENDKELFR